MTTTESSTITAPVKVQNELYMCCWDNLLFVYDTSRSTLAFAGAYTRAMLPGMNDEMARRNNLDN